MPALWCREDLLDDMAGLGILVGARDQPWTLAFGPARLQALAVALRDLGDDPVGRFQDRLGAAVVLFQLDDRRPRKLFGKVEDVADRGPAKRIDRLGVVPDHGQARAVRAKLLEDSGLDGVRVLVLIDQDAVEPLADGITGETGSASSLFQYSRRSSKSKMFCCRLRSS